MHSSPYLLRTLIALVALLTLFSIAQAKSQYKVTSKNATTSSVTLILEYFGKDQYYVKPSSPIIKNLIFKFQCLASGEFSFTIRDQDNQRFEILKGDPFPNDLHENFSFPLTVCGAELRYSDQPFDFSITNTKTLEPIFSTYDLNFIYSNYYIEVGTEVASDKIFGLGERFSVNLRKGEGKWTVWNRPGSQEMDYGTGNSSYGYYPFYLLIDKHQDSHISYFKTTQAMDVIKTQQNGKHYLTFKVVGGILHFRFIMADYNVPTLLKTFQETCIGKPAIPPFWSLGFHQSRWGYDSAATLNQVLGQYEKIGVPLDTIWSDIDYMDQLQDFTVDEENFPLSQMADIISRYRYVPIVDAGVAWDSLGYDVGHQRDVFMKDLKGRQFKGSVWPGDTAFVDFFHPNATQYWFDMLSSLYAKIKFSGIWLDMNEIEQFCDGPCEFTNETSIIDYTKELPYNPGAHPIEEETVSMNMTHYGGHSQFNVHPYFALLETEATNKFLKTKFKFPFIISRSSTFGASKYGFHWTGDNQAKWEFLRGSIVDNMNMNMAGVQMVGPDICGFGGNTTEELCARWYQMAAVYPFARSHNDYWSIPQEPYSLGDAVLKSAFVNIKMRYVFLKQFYSFWVLTKGTTPFFTSPALYSKAVSQITDLSAYDTLINTQFFILDQPLMAAPILEEGLMKRQVYFLDYRKINDALSKGSQWIDLDTGTRFKPQSNITIFNEPTKLLPMFIVEGSTFFVQDASNITKTDQLSNRHALVSAFDWREESQTYESRGTVLSISNLNNENLLLKCIEIGCKYDVWLILKRSVNDLNGKQTIQIRFRSTYKDIAVREPIIIEEIGIYLQGKSYGYLFHEPIIVYDNVDKTFVIEEGDLSQGTILNKYIGKYQNVETTHLSSEVQ